MNPPKTPAGPHGDHTGSWLPYPALPVLLSVWVLALAIYQFSENTTDPDLFGHVLFGQQMIQSGAVEKTDIYSWTARGQPFYNHEFLTDLVFARVHQFTGGTGLLLLKLAVGLSAFLLALRLGSVGLNWPRRAFAWILGAVAVVEISYGFAPRPQIFTALALTAELWLLRRIHAGAYRWAMALPLLFAIWINLHGGALAGAGLLFVAAVTTTGTVLLERLRRTNTRPPHRSPQRQLLAVLWGSFLASTAALAANPWGFGLLRWLVESVLWSRPEIAEWNPPSLGWDHAAFFFLLALAILAWCLTEREVVPWELVATLAFGFLALRAVRNTPLFALVALALVPPHLASTFARLRGHLPHARRLLYNPLVHRLTALLLTLASLGIGFATFTLHKGDALTMEVPRRTYPLAAIEFIQETNLRGNLLVFFDWGDLCLWQLPDCPPSIDGRLDACYPHQIITDHWRLYNDSIERPVSLNLEEADLALLPSNLAGALSLAKEPAWRAVYYDDVAVVLVRNWSRFTDLRKRTLPVEGPPENTQGRVPFPNSSPRWQQPAPRPP